MHGFPLDGAANSRISSTPIRSLARIQKGDRQATRKEGKRDKERTAVQDRIFFGFAGHCQAGS
jgi:hypothetical protein